MIIAWLSANKFGYELFKVANKIFPIDYIITLDEKSDTTMYDRIPTREWYKLGTITYQVKDINKSKDILEILKPDLIFVAGWRQKIDKELLDKYKFIGFHPTLLPKGRGPAPIINSILTDFKDTGVTMFYLDNELDSGDIIDQQPFWIEDNDHAEDVYNRMIECGKSLIEENLRVLFYGVKRSKKQDGRKATYFKKPKVSDNKIDLNDSLENIHKKIRALSHPYLGAYIERDGKKLIIWEAELVNE